MLITSSLSHYETFSTLYLFWPGSFIGNNTKRPFVLCDRPGGSRKNVFRKNIVGDWQFRLPEWWSSSDSTLRRMIVVFKQFHWNDFIETFHLSGHTVRFGLQWKWTVFIKRIGRSNGIRHIARIKPRICGYYGQIDSSLFFFSRRLTWVFNPLLRDQHFM